MIGSLLLIALGVILGGTVLQDQVASAKSLAQSVLVNNTPAQAVPVREQNVDANGNIRVHERGIVSVANAGAPLEVELVFNGQKVYTVPAGKWFEIRYVNIHQNVVAGGTRPQMKLVHGTGGNDFEYSFLGSERQYPIDASDFVFSGTVLISAGPGDTIELAAGPTSGTEATLSGYLLDA